MTTLAPWIEQGQHVTSDLREQFWSDLARRTRQLLAFTRSTGGESGGVGGAIAGSLSAGPRGPALQAVYPWVAHQRCWVHTLRNLLGAVQRRDHAATCGSFLLV